MSEVNGVWILDEGGTTLFSYEIYTQGSEEYSSALFSGFIASIQQFSTQLGEKNAERIEMGKTKYFISKDSKLKLLFVIKTTQMANNSKISKILSKIQKRFKQKFEKFLQKYTLFINELRVYIDDNFTNEVKELLRGTATVTKDQFSDFFNSI